MAEEKPGGVGGQAVGWAHGEGHPRDDAGGWVVQVHDVLVFQRDEYPQADLADPQSENALEKDLYLYQCMTHDETFTIIRKRLRIQLEQVIPCQTEVECQGPFPNRPNADSSHGLRLPLWKAVRCLYCGFYFCESCARIHFGETGENVRRAHIW